MARGRMISRSISTSLKVNSLSIEGALLFSWIIPHTDDWGRMQADPMGIKGTVVPMRDEYNRRNIDLLLRQMQSEGLLVLYDVGGQAFLEIVGNDEHQTFHRKRSPSKFPAPPMLQVEHLSAASGALECSEESADPCQKAPKSSQVKSSQVIPPTPQGADEDVSSGKPEDPTPLRRILNTWTQRVAPVPSSIDLAEIRRWADAYPVDRVIEAIQTAGDRKPEHPRNYIRTILQKSAEPKPLATVTPIRRREPRLLRYDQDQNAFIAHWNPETGTHDPEHPVSLDCPRCLAEGGDAVSLLQFDERMRREKVCQN